jgi:hypothetical protein
MRRATRRRWAGAALAALATACGSAAGPAPRDIGNRGSASAPTAPDDAAAFRPVVRGELAEVEEADHLYERPGSPFFFTRIRITNRAAVAIGVDLREYTQVIFPNQWGGLATPTRLVIDETRLVPVALDALRASALRSAFAASPSPLVRVEPGASVDYYREFNASGRAEVDAVTEPYVFVSLSGQLLLTDGTRCENLGLDPPATGTLGDAGAFATPIRWGVVPAGAHVVTD